MPDSLLSNLPAAATLTGAEVFYGVQVGNDVKMTPAQMLAYASDPIAGRGGSPLAVRQQARKLLRAAARALPITMAATLATVSQGASGAASTIVPTAGTGLSGPTILWNDARLTDIGGVWTIDADAPTSGYIASHVSNKASGNRRTNVNGAGKRFGTDAQAFDVVTFGGPIRVAATDLTTGLRQWYTADVAVGSAFYYTKFDFGSRAPRIIEIYFGGGSSFWGRGFNVLPTDSVWSVSQPDEARLCVFGDSYAAGTNNDSIKSRYSDILGERFGANPIVSAASGSGYLTAVGGFTWRQRIVNGDLDISRVGMLDLIFLFGTVNDGAQTDANVQAEVMLCIQAMMAAQPGAIILVGGPQYTPGLATGASRYAAIQAGVVAAAAGDPRVVYIDNSPTGEAWQTGNGRAVSLTASPSGTNAGTLTANWPGTTGTYTLLFSDGSTRSGTLTNGSTAVTWTGAVATATGTDLGAYTVVGNNALYMEPAGTHWNANGNRYGGRRIANSIINQLRLMAA